MTILDSTFQDGNYKTLEKKYLAGLLSLNDILQESLGKICITASMNLALMCHHFVSVRMM